jgi:glycosyltransferase involved in cell wall biosynthesis
MSSIRPVFLATYPPEQCGLATFTKDSADAVDSAAGRSISEIIAIEKTHLLMGSVGRVAHVIDNSQSGAYRNAASVVNEGHWDVVSLQHEFGLYPGDWGQEIMQFVRNCKVPIVCTLHTLLTNPGDLPRRLIRELSARSESTIVMTKIAASLLRNVYGISNASVRIIPHGVPIVPYNRDRSHRSELGLAGRKVLCTFGLINPGKGLESMIRAMPQIVDKCPEAIYYIVGVTHPQVKRQTGEVYREQLIELAASLGVSENVRFVNQYLSLHELIVFLQSCDVFITPYPGKDQIASGTMAYAMAAVGAVVSTPYLYAKEVLADGRGLVVPFSCERSLADAVLRYLTESQLLETTRRQAYLYAKSMFWPTVGKQYLDTFEQAASRSKTRLHLHAPATVNGDSSTLANSLTRN